MTNQQHVSIVTGGARGIGAAIAERLASDGHSVCIADIDVQAADAEVRRLAESGARAMACQTDVSQLASAREMANSVLERFGRIDALVNNAGVTGPALPLADYPD